MPRYSSAARRFDRLAGPPLCGALGLWDALSRRGREAPHPPKNVSRILVSKMGNIGDTVLMAPAIKSLRHAFPAARISFVATSHNVEIVSMLGGIDECIFLDHRRCLASPLYLWRFVRHLQSGRYQIAIDFDQWQHLPPLYLYLAGIPVRLGFDTAGERRAGLFSRCVPYNEDENSPGHEAEYFERLVEALGVPSSNAAPELVIDREDDRAVSTLLERQSIPAGDRIVIVYPSGRAKGGISRAWSADRFVELCNHIVASHGCTLVFVGGPDEREEAEAIAARVRGRPLVANGTLSLGRLAALLRRASLFVGNEGGPMHVAAAVGVPCVSLFGPTNASRWGAYGQGHINVVADVPCSPCFFLGAKRRDCVRQGACMDSISLDAVKRAVDEVLARALPQRVEAESQRSRFPVPLSEK
ncbi:MAG: glycosyltransferase family 9 protein [Dehalococcoidia bacterium]|jgi:ADP-heptose:LPS heptosyltransferase